MKKIVAIVLSVCLLNSCRDLPYPEKEPTLLLEESASKKVVPVDNIKDESANAQDEPPITDVDHPVVRPAVNAIEDADSDNRRRSNGGRTSNDNVVPPILPPVEEEAKNSILPKIEITSPINNSLIADRKFEITGIIEHSKLIQSMKARYQGLSEANNLIAGEKIINKTENNFSVVFDDLADGDYGLSMVFVDINGIEHLLPDLKVSIDCTPPKILGALDGIVQPAYLQETTHFEQRFIDDASNPRYEIVPAGEPAPLKFDDMPSIHRWHTRVFDENTAPIYSFKISDSDVAEIKYAIDLECASFEKTSREAVREDDSNYEIKIIPSAPNSDLDGKKFCLSIWATDLAGNKANHQAEFIWKIVIPPVALDMNAARYQAHSRRDDVSWADRPVRQLFRDSSPIALKRDLVIGHTIISNPFSSPLAIKLEMKKPLNLKIYPRFYNIPANSVDIKYYAYDLAKNEIGLEKPVDGNFAVIDGNESLVAKFILKRAFPLTGIRAKRSFWRSFSLEVGFLKSVNSGPLVDGLSLITRGSVDGLLSSEFVVPWGENHEVRKKAAPRNR